MVYRGIRRPRQLLPGINSTTQTTTATHDVVKVSIVNQINLVRAYVLKIVNETYLDGNIGPSKY